MGDNPVGQDGVEGRFREAMAGLLKRLQAYESDPTLEELYRKYGTALNGTATPRPQPAVRPVRREGSSSGEKRAVSERGPAREGSSSGSQPAVKDSQPRPVASTLPSGSQPRAVASAPPSGSQPRPVASHPPSGSQPRPVATAKIDLSQMPPLAPPPVEPVAPLSQAPPPSGEIDLSQAPPPSGEINLSQAPPPSDEIDLSQAPPPSDEIDLSQAPPPSDEIDLSQAPPPSGEASGEPEEQIVEEELVEEEVLEDEEILEEIVLEEGEEILEEEWVEESGEPSVGESAESEAAPALQQSGEFDRVPSRNASVELPGGYAGQATMFSTAPAMSPAQPAGAAFAPPGSPNRVTAKLPISELMTPAPAPAEPRPLTQEEEDERAKRRVARIKCDYVAPARSDKGDVFEVRITDLAIEGAGISAAVPLERGQVVTISQPPSVSGQLGQPVQGRLMWVQSAGGRTEAGVMFIDSHEAMSTSWVVELLDHLTVDENQSLMEDRTLAEKKETLTVRAESKEGVKAVGRLLNLGLGSAKCSLDGEYKKNTKIDVILGPYQELEALLLPGQVLSVREDDEDDRWVHDIRFLDKSSHQTGVLGRYVLALLQESDI